MEAINIWSLSRCQASLCSLALVVCSPLHFFKRLTRVIKDTEKVHFVIMSGKLIMEGCRLMTHFPGLITCVLANYIG